MSLFADPPPPISAVDPASAVSGVDGAGLVTVAGGKRDASGATQWERDGAADQSDYGNY